MRRFFYWVAALLFVASICGCKDRRGFERPATPVTIAEAVTRDVPLYLDEIGSCTAREVVAIRPQASGKITQIYFADGAELKKGDMLFTIDPRPYQAALDQAKATLAQNMAQLVLAKADFQRAEELLPSKAISKEDYDTRKNAVAVGEAQVQAGQAAVETAQVNLDYCFIRSPIDGRASLRQVDVGNVVTAASGGVGGDTLLVIQRLEPIYADFTITERDLSPVREEMAKGTLKVYVRLPDEPDTNMPEGDLTFLDNAVQTATGTVKLRAALPNKDRHFWPGQFVWVTLVLSIIKDAVLIPNAAVQISQQGPYVYVLMPDSTVQLRLVKPGQRQGALVVITEGLKAGEKVVTSGHLTIAPGGKVRVMEAPSGDQNQPAPAYSSGAKQ